MNILSKNLLILASAGSGKTFQLANRVIGLVTRGAEPEKIVALTFTRKAAAEFADSVLTKLANAADNPSHAASLRTALDQADADFQDALERVVRALPNFTLGTMDGYFAKIVRSFQYELGLTGGKFDLLEGPRAAVLADEMLASVLGSALMEDQSEGFFHAFRRATIGRENHGVTTALRGFVNTWQTIYQESPNLEWGPAELVTVRVDEWEKQKSALTASVLNHLDSLDYTQKNQRDALENAVSTLGKHVIGSGSLSKKPALLDSIFEAVATQNETLTVKSYKEFAIHGRAADALRSMVELAASCELAAAVSRTRAVREIVAVFDDLCSKNLRSKGLLGFNDVKILMGRWATGEDARLRREAVDFRLTSRTDHWLLDEFQDTSRADWNGLLPLIDEAATDDESSVFIVGDRKQAIYAWRGGDVTLFDEIMRRYHAGLETAEMAESWRSCPQVLALVNQICGDSTTLHSLFGEIAKRWQWQTHVPAPPLLETAKRGHARVEVIGTWEERLDRLPEILSELGIGKRSMTCGILLRGNEKAHEVADHLRSHGFDVIEEGHREPAKDSPAGILIHHLLKWLANPSDVFAREVLEISPLAPTLKTTHGASWPEVWENLTALISSKGFAETIGSLISGLWHEWSDFERRRASDLLAALATLDAGRGVSLREAADWLDRLEISQNPGVAAVQVMTIHKAKGLGFDVVILPEIPDDSLLQTHYFDIARGDGWLTETPPQWARTVIPEMRDAEARWAEAQCYEAFCMLYVALTRAKRGLYVLLSEPAKTSKPDKPSLANWIIQSLGGNNLPSIIYQNGLPDWSENLPDLSTPEKKPSTEIPGPAIPRRSRTRPSGTNPSHLSPAHSQSAIRFGSDVHALLENTAWTDETPTILPATDAGQAVAKLLKNPDLNQIFQRQNRSIQLFREQSIDAIIGDTLLNGVIDRLHLHQNSDGTITQIEIIDFKTDAIKSPGELVERYSSQMHAYRTAMEKIYPNAAISCILISTFLSAAGTL